MPISGGPANLLEGLADQFGRLRYGVPTSEKERLARTRGSLPGMPPVSESAEESDRYASGYLFGQTWPRLAPEIQSLIDRIKVSDLPLVGGSTPELQSYATQGVNAGRRAR